jgi:hypothetical protein
MVFGSNIPPAIIVLGDPSNRLEWVGFEYGGGKYRHTQTHTHSFLSCQKITKVGIENITHEKYSI